MKKDKEIITNIIVDLYEMKGSTFLPIQARKMEKTYNAFQYNFFALAIARLCDKYDISGEDIEEVIRKRSLCKTCGGTREVSTMERVYSNEPHMADVGSIKCPDCN
jgi:hypothetical protein